MDFAGPTRKPRVSLLKARPLPTRSVPLPGVSSTLSCLAPLFSPFPLLENVFCLPLLSGKCLIALRRAQCPVSTGWQGALGCAASRSQPGPLPHSQTPAWPSFPSSEAVLPGLGGSPQQFPLNSQADCRHLCCQQNCRKCNSCC